MKALVYFVVGFPVVMFVLGAAGNFLFSLIDDTAASLFGVTRQDMEDFKQGKMGKDDKK